jgi:uncharacterized protein YggE
MPKLTSLILVFITGCAFAADEIPHTITVSGVGSVETPPDRATLILSIVARDQSVAAAQAEAAEVTAKVLALTDELGIPDNRVDTMSASVRPDYRWNREREEQELRGYIAERQMRIEIRDLEQVGVVVERAVEAGVNQVSPPQLTSSKRRDAYRDALERAADDARANAERLAGALGVNLGTAMQVNAGPGFRPPMPMMGVRQADAMAMEAAPETYNAGDMTVTATVSVVFELTE